MNKTTSTTKVFIYMIICFVMLAMMFIFVNISICKYVDNLQKDNTRDISYEQYCDSIWTNNSDYYLDVLVESDKYQQYIENNGEWWNK